MVKSKEYFAKYIPVKDEIKVGDMIYDLQTGKTNGFNVTGVKKKTVVIDFPNKFMNKGRSLVVNKATCKKAELFLFSTDIKKGDKFFRFSNLRSFTVNDKNLRSFTAMASLKYGGKLIGKISPEATWIKNGDEFNESEVSLKWFKILKESGTIKIKCSNCNHFH